MKTVADPPAHIGVAPSPLFLPDWDVREIMALGQNPKWDDDRQHATVSSFRPVSAAEAARWTADGRAVGEKTDAFVQYFSFPNHLHEALWDLDLEAALSGSGAIPQPRQTTPVHSEHLEHFMSEVSCFLEVVDRRFSTPKHSHVCIARWSDFTDCYSFERDIVEQAVGHPVTENKAPVPRCAAWINIDEQDQFAIVVGRCSSLNRDPAIADLGSGAPSVCRLTIRPKEGILWFRNAVIVSEALDRANPVTIKLLFSQ